MKGIITQSNYIPWKGFFDSLGAVDNFIVYDDMQYTKRDWRNRNLIKTPNGLKWLSVPVEVKGKYFQKIKDTKIADKSWNKNHLNMIKQNYRKAKCFSDVFPWLEELYMSCEYGFITEVNMHFIRGINAYLGNKPKIQFSSDFDLHEEKNQRLIDLCLANNISTYYSGPAAQSYMDLEMFSDAQIKVVFWDYSNYKKYEQLHDSFEGGVSVIDLLLNEGLNSKEFFKFSK